MFVEEFLLISRLVTPHSFEQIGILTKPGGNENLILPLMGRPTDTGRDKWEFYAISNSGSVNTKFLLVSKAEIVLLNMVVTTL